MAQWCWRARGCSWYYVGCEFAQSTAGSEITDAQVRAFCWVLQQARSGFPAVRLAFPLHAEVDGTALYGGRFDGKSDVFPEGDRRADELRSRIVARLEGSHIQFKHNSKPGCITIAMHRGHPQAQDVAAGTQPGRHDSRGTQEVAVREYHYTIILHPEPEEGDTLLRCPPCPAA